MYRQKYNIFEGQIDRQIVIGQIENSIDRQRDSRLDRRLD